ncbi:MAG: glycosyltransferase [Spirochaetes bacterium]|nr:glycosyltransferase [Spirochaetota bacterium]
MQIGFLVGAFPIVSEKFILNQITCLLDQGIDVEILTSDLRRNTLMHSIVQRYQLLDRTTEITIPYNFKKRLLQMPFLLIRALFRHPVHTLQALYPRYSTASRNLKNLYYLVGCTNKRFDILHCHFGPNGLIGAYLKDIGVTNRLIVTFHGSDITRYPLRRGIDVYRTMYQKADAITAGTVFVKKKLIENGCPEEKIHLLPAGIRMEEHPLVPFEHRDPYLVLSVGRLVDIKGFHYAIEGFQKVKERIPQAKYMIVGNGPEKPALEALATSLGLSEHVKLVGEKIDHEVQSLYNRASVFVLPSIVTPQGAEEGQGLVLQEAQASGIPVVATNIGGIPEGMIDGVTGFLVPQKDSKAIAEKIIYLLEHSDSRRRMGEAARAYVQDRFSMEMLTNQLIRLYSTLL